MGEVAFETWKEEGDVRAAKEREEEEQLIGSFKFGENSIQCLRLRIVECRYKGAFTFQN